MITWQIKAMLVQKQVGDMQSVVYMVDWDAVGTDGVNEARIGGATPLSPPAGDFTPYAQLTEAQVVSWVQAALGPVEVASIESKLNAQLAYMVNPPVEAPPLPWLVG